ncbi:hypothetical protein AVDCRST_MAG81-759 [uncultured Synechococcales cyanobacterium]|uniref:Chromosome segregation ATPase n=1 Tax=uncultured Synechococcales cyanobacterium TaxID=1936017 RepID=A0A6J4UUF4_9CYAN|nr:hypothetical protein AVDCRST_MAG81-759 [uncultured Synechococcales cyanobacterium]
MTKDDADQRPPQEANLFSQAPARFLHSSPLSALLPGARSFKHRIGGVLERVPLPTSWVFWAGVGTVGFASAGAIAIALLLRIPGIPNCPRIFWPTASGSLRLYCAQVAADKQTLDNLLEAIALVNGLPANHPLRPDINRLVEKWSLQVLEQGESAFQSGQLKRAIEISHQVPKNTRAHQLVPQQIDRWRDLWVRAEKIYQKAESALQQENWRRAFTHAVHLLAVDNRYWETTRYEELNQKILVAQQDDKKLSKAKYLFRQGGLDNLSAALQLIAELSPNTYFHKTAQATQTDISRNLLDLAATALANQNLQEATNIAGRIPTSVSFWAEAQDFMELAQAEASTWSDDISGLESAISEAKKLGTNRPLYERAQELIAGWKLEIAALKILNPARSLAQQGDTRSLNSAIAQVQVIPPGNPRWSAAQQDINQWTQQVQTIEDQPTLDQADQFASVGDLASLNSAVRTARRIGPGRALYQEAQSKIQDWVDQLQAAKAQQQQEQELQQLDGRSQQLMQSGWDLAVQGTPKALASAIQTANQVSSFSSQRAEADAAIDQWSQEILEMARQRASYDRTGAIAIAQLVPRSTSAFAEAQSDIQLWKGN